MLLTEPTCIDSDASFKPMQTKEARSKFCSTVLRYMYTRVETNDAASSASDQKCSTSADKPFSSRLCRKNHLKSRVKPLKNVLHFAIEAEGVESYA